MTRARVAGLIAHLPDGVTELYCHPATEDAYPGSAKAQKHLDQVQTFTPTPMAMATAMYHSGKNPLRKVTETSEEVAIPKAGGVRRLHKAFIRYHDPNNWPMLREALRGW